jgi:EAL and modified HD-GYP domain-containing signal transduction protein
MDVFIARQPIFDQQQRVYAYELLYRSGQQNFCTAADLNDASRKVIANSGLLLSTINITDGKKAFINVTRDILLDETIELLPRDLTVVELLETIEPEAEVIAACRKLRDAGYQLALDDFIWDARFEPLIELADIIKVDFLLTRGENRLKLSEQLQGKQKILLAEKVETPEEYQEGIRLGYSLFQGYFFCKPMILSRKDLPGNKLSLLRILQEIQQPDIDLAKLEEVIRRDLSLTYKLLRYLNSAAFQWKNEIETIRHALLLLGEKQIKKWASLIVLTSLGSDKSEELMLRALIRAGFCESLASRISLPERAEDFFLTGLFSLIDAILDRPLAELLKDLPLSSDIQQAIQSHDNLLHQALQTVMAYEQGDWTTLSAQAARLKLDESQLPELYLKTVEWARQSFQAGS